MLLMTPPSPSLCIPNPQTQLTRGVTRLSALWSCCAQHLPAEALVLVLSHQSSDGEMNRLLTHERAPHRDAQKAREEAYAALKSSTHPAMPKGSSNVEIAANQRERSQRAADSIASTLRFTPITLVWRDVSYYVPVAKGLSGEAARNIMPKDADNAIAGKKRLLNDLTGAHDARERPSASAARLSSGR